jgi:thioredoxin reductase
MATAEHHKFIIVGAGPAGLQMGYLLEKTGQDYIILERAAAAGAFYDKFPHSGKLVSYNKVYTGNENYEYNLRTDWNSLVSEEKYTLKEFSLDIYPSRKDYVRYLNEFAKRVGLRIAYEADVKAIHKGSADAEAAIDTDADTGVINYRLEVSHQGTTSKLYTCMELIVATGHSVANIPAYVNNCKKAPLHYCDYEKDFFRKTANLEQFRNKSVLLIGNGNAAFELSTILTPYCKRIVIHGRRVRPMAMISHYPGDIRAPYLGFHDTCLLSSSGGNAVDIVPAHAPILDQGSPTTPYKVSFLCTPGCKEKHDYEAGTEYDHVIFCTGRKMDTSIFSFPVETVAEGRFPRIQMNYESAEYNHLYFIGKLMHAPDYRRGAGGFVHGYRHLIEYMFRLNFAKGFDTDVFSVKKIDDLVEQLFYKINYSAPLACMAEQMGDFFWPDPEKDGEILYFNNLATSFLMSLAGRYPTVPIFMLTLEYGRDFVKDVPRIGIKEGGVGQEARSTMLHPVLRVYKKGNKVDEIHFDESLSGGFTDRERYMERIRRVLKMYF